MRIGVVGVAVLFAAQAVNGWGQSTREKAETVARWHFAGTKQVAELKDVETFRKVLALPQTTELRDVGLNGFALQVAQRFTRGKDTNANNRVAALIRPLLTDLVENENSFELTARGAQDADWALAVKLPSERVAEWSKNLSALAASSQMQTSATDKAGAWSAQRDQYRLNFSPEKDWLVLQGGFGPNPGGKRSKNLLRRLGKDVLTAEVNLPKIAAMWNAERFKHAPRLDLKVTPRRGVLRSEMEIEYPADLNIKPERWKVPAELIHDPLVGFTAVQGVSDRLAHSERFRGMGAQQTPNQVFLWSQGTAPFTVFAAAEVGNPATVVSNIAHSYLPKVQQANGRFVVLTNRPAILWRGLPAVVPFVEAAEDGRSPYLMAGLFPVSSVNPKPAPAELLAQLNKRNLVYYDWEITEERLKQWRPIWQFSQILRGKMFSMSASDHWIDAVMPLLGNTVTEVTLEKKNRLKLVRTSQSGLTALEIVLLAHILDTNDLSERSVRPPGQQPPPRRRPNPATPPKR